MRGARFGYACFVAAAVFCGPSAAFAQDAELQALKQQVEMLRQQLEAMQKQYEARLNELEARAGAAAPGAPGATPAPPTAEIPAGAAGAGGPSGQLPVYGRATTGSNVFNPDMAVIGNFLGAIGRNVVDPAPALEMHESEASFQAVVDPYARADFFMAFGESGVELEEGYLTFPTLPGGLLAKVGKMRAAFGKVNMLHNHVLPWTDRPLAVSSLLNGEEGISDAGLSVARLVPNRWIFLEATGQVFRGDSGELFQSSKRGHLAYVGHLRGYQDLSESTNVDLGASYAYGHNNAGAIDGIDVSRFLTRVWGVDATVRWRPLQRSIYRSFIGRSELFWSNREQSDGRQDAFGYYVSAEYQFGRRWFAGFRYDESERADAANVSDNGQSVLLTYWPSEFSQVRGQYRRTRYASEHTANELLFQFMFNIGAHGAHPF